MHKTGSTIFKTYNNDLDGFINKIGFSKRSLVEFDEQVAQAFDNGTSKVNKFTNAIKAMFTVQKESQNEWKRTDTGDIVTESNIDSYIPKLDTDAARKELQNLQNIQKQINATQGSWDDYNKQFEGGREYLLEYAKANNVLKASVDDVKAVNLQARDAALAHNAGLKTMTAGAKVAKVAVAALNATISMGVTLLISEAIEWVMKWANAEEEAAEKAKEEAEKAKEAKQKLRDENKESAETAKEELNTIKDLISQYEQFKNITYLTTTQKETLKGIQDQLIETFGDEADGIDLINGKYRENIELLKEEQRLKAQEAIRTQKVVVDDYKDDINDTKRNDIWLDAKQDAADIDFFNRNWINGITLTYEYDYEEDGDYLMISGDNSYEKIEMLDKALEAYEKEGLITETYKKLVEKRKYYQDEINKYNESLDDLAQTYIDSFEPVPKNASKKEYEDWQKRLLAYVNDNNNVEYSYWTDENGTPYESLDYIASLGDNLLNEAIIKASEEYYQGNNSLVDEEAIEKSLNEYSTKISEFLSEKEKIDSAFKEQAENGSISEKTALDLIQSGYGNAIVNEAGSYKLLREEIDKTAKSRRAETKASLDSDKTKLQSIVDDELERLQKDIDDGNVDSAEAKQRRNEIEEIQDLIDKYNLYIPMLETADTATSKYTESIEAENEALEKTAENLEKIDNAQATVNKAIEEQNEFGRLSADSIKALHEAGLGTALAYNEATGETTLLVDSVYDLYDAMLDVEEQANQVTMQNLKDSITEIQEQIRNFTVNSAADAEIAKGLYSNLDEAQEAYNEAEMNQQTINARRFSFESSDQKSAEDAHEEYINSIKEAFDKEKSELDHLLAMDAISQEDYFNKLHNLNEKYFKDKTDLLDEYRQYEEEVYKGLKQVQIDAIQEQIDALKSVNEEKQEEIDLEKAKLALENAKKNRNVRVYDSERGWIYETNREAIDSAQKEYDDLVLNEKVEELENVIKAIEEGRNTSHTLNESVNAVQQVDGMIDLTKYFTNLSDQEAQMIREVQKSVFRGIGANDVFSQQISNKMPNNSNYETVNNNLSLSLHDVTVVANNPEEFLSEMKRVANESFKNNFPTAMNNFADGLNRYRMNHS